MHVDETIIITVEYKRTKTIRVPCKNSATSGGSKHKTLICNSITVLICVQKLIFEQYPSRRGSKDGNKLVEDHLCAQPQGTLRFLEVESADKCTHSQVPNRSCTQYKQPDLHLRLPRPYASAMVP